MNIRKLNNYKFLQKLVLIFRKNKNDCFAIIVLILLLSLFLLPSFLLKDVTGDFITQEVPWHHFTFTNIKDGIIPFWTPYALSGVPYLFKPELAFFHPLTLLTLLLNFIFNSKETIGMTGQIMEMVSILNFCIGAVGIYLLARKALSLSSIAAIFTAVAYILNPFTLFQMHSTTVLDGVALLPWLILFLLRYLNKPSLISFLLIVIGNYLLFLGYSYHYVYFLSMEVGLVAIYNLRRLPLFLLSVIISFLLSSFYLFSYLDIYAQSARNASNHELFFHSFASLTPYKILEIINPISYSTNVLQSKNALLFGGPTLTFGTFAFIFLLYGFFSLRKNRLHIWLVAVFFIGLLYSFGGNLQSHEFFGTLMPLVYKFRFHARAFICVIFAAALLIGLGVQAIKEQTRIKFIELFLWAVFLLLVVGLILGQLFFFERIQANIEVFKGTSISLLFLFISLIITALVIKYGKNSFLIIGLIVMLLEYNLFFHNASDFFTKNISYDQFYKLNSLIPETSRNENLFRIYFEDNQFAYNTSVFTIYNMNGYENNPYQAQGERATRYGLFHFYQLANLKYVVTTNPDWEKGNPNVTKVKTINPLTLPKETFFHSPDKLHYVYKINNFLPRFMCQRKWNHVVESLV